MDSYNQLYDSIKKQAELLEKGSERRFCFPQLENEQQNNKKKKLPSKKKK